jgi:nucleoside-diphosphate-sugar epimerase
MTLITGASGFVGSSCLKFLSSRGYDVCGVIRSTSNLKRLANTDVELRYAELTDLNQLTKIMKDCRTVVHCAARSLDWGQPDDFWRVNVGGVRNIVEAAHRVETIKKVVHISTANVVGFGTREMIEKPEIQNKLQFAYSRSKLEGECVAQELCHKYHIELIILRPSAVYGPEDWKWSFEMIDRIAHSSWPLINRGKAVFTPVFIDNFCQSVELALGKIKTGEIYNITDDVTISWIEFCSKIASALGVSPNYKNFPSPIAIGVALLSEIIHKLFIPDKNPNITLYRVLRSSKDFHYSCEYAKKSLGYQPDSDIDSHIDKTVRWYQRIINNH